MYATYTSLERIVQAHRDFGLPAWDLVVIDEAHRTAGSEGKAWAAVHHDADVPALRRLYFTATPRIADYRVLVPVVTDEDLRELLNLPAVADLRSQRSNEELLRLALQIAVLRAVADLGLRRVITFHSRVSSRDDPGALQQALHRERQRAAVYLAACA
ncbi:DEAD/DEAH box helicase family protein [Kitasatospora sp. NPDC097643]|uniref:DEAD/DEAH box helicase family protein n=1 Tax=Kitasatospora sp. NPDC097643 TaxID=3157230 RepID=UPI00332683FC